MTKHTVRPPNIFFIAVELMEYWQPKTISLTWLQRKLLIGFNDAVDLFRELEARKIVGPEGKYLERIVREDDDEN